MIKCPAVTCKNEGLSDFNGYVTGSFTLPCTSVLICLTVILVVQRVVRHPGRRSVAATSGKEEKKGFIGAENRRRTTTQAIASYVRVRACPAAILDSWTADKEADVEGITALCYAVTLLVGGKTSWRPKYKVGEP
jgi:hypothetical protein